MSLEGVLPLRLVLFGLVSLSQVAWGQLPIGTFATTAGPGDQDSPSIGMRDDGRFTVVWREGPAGNSSKIVGRNYQADGTPFAASDISVTEPAIQTDPRLAMNRNGDRVTTWLSDQITASQTDLFGRRTTNNGSILHDEVQFNATNAHVVARHRVSVADNDQFVVSWRDDDTGLLYYRLYDTSGSALTGDSLAHPTAVSGLDSDVAAFADGSFVVVFANPDGASNGIFGRCFDNTGAPEGVAFPVNEVTTSDQGAPRVATDALGGFVVAWHQSPSTIEFRRFGPSCTPLGGDLQANTITGGIREDIDIDMAADGAFVLVWASNISDGNDNDTLAREFTKSGEPVGPEFITHNAVDGNSDNPAVAINGGSFIVVWEDQDLSDPIDDTIVGSRYRRRVVFSDDFESGNTAYWSALAP